MTQRQEFGQLHKLELSCTDRPVVFPDYGGALDFVCTRAGQPVSFVPEHTFEFRIFTSPLHILMLRHSSSAPEFFDLADVATGRIRLVWGDGAGTWPDNVKPIPPDTSRWLAIRLSYQMGVGPRFILDRSLPLLFRS